MDQWQALVATAIVGALAYLFNSDKNKARSMASIETSLKQLLENQVEMKHQISEDKQEMKETQEAIKLQQKNIDDKLNLFLKSEIDTLKELVRQDKKTRNQG
jgi:soluble cytochrome b562